MTCNSCRAGDPVKYLKPGSNITCTVNMTNDGVDPVTLTNVVIKVEGATANSLACDQDPSQGVTLQPADVLHCWFSQAVVSADNAPPDGYLPPLQVEAVSDAGPIGSANMTFDPAVALLYNPSLGVTLNTTACSGAPKMPGMCLAQSCPCAALPQNLSATYTMSCM